MLDQFSYIVKELLAKGLTIDLVEGEYLFKQNEIPESIYFILKGEILCVSDDGSKKLIPRNSLYGVKELLTEEPYKCYAIALCDTKLVLMDKENIISILNKNRKYVLKYIFSLSKNEVVYE